MLIKRKKKTKALGAPRVPLKPMNCAGFVIERGIEMVNTIAY